MENDKNYEDYEYGGIYRENRKMKNKGEIREPNKENRENYYGK